MDVQARFSGVSASVGSALRNDASELQAKSPPRSTDEALDTLAAAEENLAYSVPTQSRSVINAAEKDVGQARESLADFVYDETVRYFPKHNVPDVSDDKANDIIERYAQHLAADPSLSPAQRSIAVSQATTEVRQAELDVAKDLVAAAEGRVNERISASSDGRLAEYDALDGIPASQQDGLLSELFPYEYGALKSARLHEGTKQDALKTAIDAEVNLLREQGMSREDALGLMRARGYDAVFGNTSDTLQPGHMPNTVGMTQQERATLYEPNFLRDASPEARAAYEAGQPVTYAIRHDTPMSANNERGVFDDRYVVFQKDPQSGEVSVHEFDGAQDPNTQYGDGMRTTLGLDGKSAQEMGPYGSESRHTHHSRWGAFAAFPHHVSVYGRPADGTILMTGGPKEGKIYPDGDGYQVEYDLNGDGVFNDPDSQRQAKDNGYQLHGGKTDYSHTGSGGCLTLPPHQWNAYMEATGLPGAGSTQEQREDFQMYYVQSNETKFVSNG